MEVNLEMKVTTVGEFTPDWGVQSRPWILPKAT